MSTETIYKKPGGVYFRRLKNGDISYSSPATRELLSALTKSKVKHPEVKPRTETLDHWIDRLTDDIRKNEIKVRGARHGDMDNKTMGTHIRWRIATTDGHRALLIRDAKTEAKPDLTFDFSEYGLTESKRQWAQLPGELYCTVKRAMVMADERTKLVKLKFLTWNMVTVESEHPDYGSFEETIDCPNSLTDGRTMTVGLNGDYLLSALGVWPIKLYWEQNDVAKADKQVVFEPQCPAGELYRLAVMTMRVG